MKKIKCTVLRRDEKCNNGKSGIICCKVCSKLEFCKKTGMVCGYVKNDKQCPNEKGAR